MVNVRNHYPALRAWMPVDWLEYKRRLSVSKTKWRYTRWEEYNNIRSNWNKYSSSVGWWLQCYKSEGSGASWIDPFRDTPARQSKKRRQQTRSVTCVALVALITLITRKECLSPPLASVCSFFGFPEWGRECYRLQYKVESKLLVRCCLTHTPCR